MVFSSGVGLDITYTKCGLFWASRHYVFLDFAISRPVLLRVDFACASLFNFKSIAALDRHLNFLLVFPNTVSVLYLLEISGRLVLHA